MAARSGLCGPCPISPAANPANPAPSANASSRCVAGTSLAFGLPYISTNWQNRNSTPLSSTSLRTSLTVFGPSAAIFPPFLVGHSLHASKLHDLHGDGEREPVLPLQIDPSHLLDAPQ